MVNATEYQLQHWDDNRASEIIAVNVVSLAALLIAITLRIYAQSYVTNPWKHLDNWLAVAAAIFAVAISGCMLKTIDYGLGKHTLRIILEDPKAPDDLAAIFKYGYVISVLQAVCITCTKLAILSLYARVFGMIHHDNVFAYSIYGCATFCILIGVGCTTMFIVQCIPASLFWNRIYLLFPGGHTDGPTTGYCMDQTIHVVVPVGLDIVSEIAIMLLPSRMLWNLRLPMKKKIGLTVTFSLGIFVQATNFVRIVYYARMINGGDLAWDDIDSFIWTIVQMCFAVVCASIPPCAPLLKVWSGQFPRARTSQSYGRSVPLEGRLPGASFGTVTGGKTVSTDSSRISRKDDWLDDTESLRDLNGSSRGSEMDSRTSAC